MKKYLVTGGCGFIGSHLVDLLLTCGHSVVVLDDLSTGTEDYLSQKVNFYRGSILDDNILKQALEGVDGVFHLAACASVPDSIQHWSRNHLINCAGSVKVIEQARGIPLIYASSSAIYGDNSLLIQKEEGLPHPLSPYAIDKFSIEMHAALAWQLHKTPSVSFRFFNVYGSRQNPHSPYSGVISRFTTLIKNESPITIYGTGNQQRDFIYVKDVVAILEKMISLPFEQAHIYNLCSGKGTSVNELADLIGDLLESNVKKEYAPARTGEILLSIGDPSKLLQEAGLKVTTPLSAGLKEMMQEISRHSIVV